MSLIGPRPLLPVDQPSDPRLRLSVRPGITRAGPRSTAAGASVTPAEKDALDVVDVRRTHRYGSTKIARGTVLFALSGERMNHTALAQAMDWRDFSANTIRSKLGTAPRIAA